MKRDESKAAATDIESVPPSGLVKTDTGSEQDIFDATEYVRQLIARMDDEKPGMLASDTIPTEPLIHGRPPRPSNPVAPVMAPTPTLTPPPTPTPTVTHAPSFEDHVKLASPRRPNQERSVDLVKLREAANLTSSNALHTSDCNDLVRRAYYQLLFATVCTALSLTFVYLSEHVFSVAHLLGCLLLIVATFTAFRYLATAKVLWQKTRALKARSELPPN